MAEPQLPFDVDAEVAFVELAMRAQGFSPDAESLSRVRRTFTGELTRNEARAEVLRKYEYRSKRNNADR